MFNYINEFFIIQYFKRQTVSDVEVGFDPKNDVKEKFIKQVLEKAPESQSGAIEFAIYLVQNPL